MLELLADDGKCKKSQFRGRILGAFWQSLHHPVTRCFAFTRARQGHET